MIAETTDAGHVTISVTFLTGRYHGKEWPPAPSRLFQAIVASAHLAARSEEERAEDAAALRWLERQPPPVILVPPTARPGGSYTTFVPSNDGDMVIRGRKGLEDIRVEKRVRPWILEEGDRQDGRDAVQYVWPVGDREGLMKILPALRRLAHGLVCLGWGIDLVAGNAAFLDEGQLRRLRGARYEPVTSPSGTRLAVPVEGFLDDLETAFRAFSSRIGRGGIVNTATRATAYGESWYRRMDETVLGGAVLFELRDMSGAFAPVRWEDGMLVAAWLRHAVAERLRKEGMEDAWVDRNVLGHAPKADAGNHMSFVPLPSIGHEHADGAHRRVLVLLDPAHDPMLAQTLSWSLDGAWLIDEDGSRRARLSLAESLEGVPELYAGKARTWLTATPLILHGRDRVRGKLSSRKVEKLLLAAIAGAGIPSAAVESVWFQPAPFWPGTGDARRSRVPAHLASWPRYHVGIRFHVGVMGPLVLGIGRHYGFGLFATADTQP